MSWFSVSCLSLRFGLESGERAIVRQHATTTRRFIIADPLSVYSFYSMTDARRSDPGRLQRGALQGRCPNQISQFCF